MAESLLLVVDHDKICRLCLQSMSGMSDIFEKNDENSLQQLVHKATGYLLESNDGLPSKICYRCRHLVELSCDLKDMVERSQALLRSVVDNNTAIGKAEQILMHVTEPEIIQPEDSCTSLKSLSYEANKTNKTNLDENEIKILSDNQPITVTDIACNNNALDLNWKDSHEVPSRVRKSETSEELDKVLTFNKRKVSPKYLTCQICLSVFTNVQEVERHVASHYNKDSRLTPYTKLQRPYQCEECNNEAVSKSQLIVHHRRHLNVNPFVCKEPGCNFAGKNQDSLRHHNLKHKARLQVCEVCGAAYRRSFELLQHKIRTHNEANTVQCQTCRRYFRNILSLRQHSNICKKPHRYTCEWTGCGKTYHSRAQLAAHRRTHRDERAFRCHLCDVAAYTSKSMLNRHLRTHSRRRACKCDRCAAVFSDYGAYYSHRVAAHGPWQPYRCNLCNCGYQSEANLEKHLKTCESATKYKQTERTARTKHQLNVTSAEEIKDLELEGEISKDSFST